MEEIWKDIPQYEGIYQVSNLGRVKTIKTGLIRKEQPNKADGYLYVTLSKGKCNQWKAKIHRLVGITFFGLHPTKKFIDHKDGDKHNNKLNNLRWVTFQENITAAWENGLYKNKGELHPMSKLTTPEVVEIKKRLLNGERLIDIASTYNVNINTICGIKKGRIWKHV